MKRSLESRLKKLEKTGDRLPHLWFYDSITETSAYAADRARDAGVQGEIAAMPLTMSRQDWQEAAISHMERLKDTLIT